jgi:7-cyano-7-deazaguanine reductase
MMIFRSEASRFREADGSIAAPLFRPFAPTMARQSASQKKPARSTAAPQAQQRPAPLNPPSAPSKELHVFPNPAPERDYVIQFQIPEFTCHCPLTGQPDFAHFTIDVVADKLCVELKSLKMYMWSFRDEGAFHEKVTNDILSKIVAVTQPRYARITARWYVRGGIYTNVIAEHRKKGWKADAIVPAPQLPQATGL